MVKKSNFLKNLLTTASVLAVTASAGTAMADARVTTGAAATQAGVNLDNVGGGNVAFVGGSTLTFRGAHTYTPTAAGVANIAAINVEGNNAILDATASNTSITIGSITKTPNANAALTINVNNGNTITLSGVGAAAQAYQAGALVPAPANWAFATGDNDYTGLGNINLNHANDKLDIKSGATLNGNINGVGDNKGTIEINGSNVLFNGYIGNTGSVKLLDIKGGKAATLAKAGNNKIVTVTIANGSSLSINDGVNLESTDINGAVAGQGELKFDGASTAKITNIGNGAALASVTIGNGLVDLSTTAVLKATKTTLNGANSAIKFTAAANSTTDFETATNGEGKITFGDDHTANGNFGADGLALNTVEVIDAKTLTIQKNAGKLYVNNVTATANGTAKIEFQGANYEIHANIGTDANKFAEVNFKGDIANAATTFKLMAGKTIHSTTVDLANANNVDNTLELHEGSSIIGNVDTANANKGFLSVKGDATVSSIGATNAINQVKFDEAKTLTVTKNTVNANAGINFIKDGTL